MSKISATRYIEKYHMGRSTLFRFIHQGKIKSAEQRGAYWYIEENESPPTNKRHKGGGKQRETLCWSCQKFYNGCAWTRTLKEPVKGWTAEPRISDGSGWDPVQSYLVLDCPEYLKDEPRRRKTCQEDGI